MWVQSVGLVVQVVRCLPAFWGVHLVRVVRLPVVVLPLVVCSVPLSLCCFCLPAIALKYAFICDSKGVFSAVWGVRVGLCCLGLCVACVAFVRVWS